MTTVVHETFHGLYRKALADGTVSQAEALQFVRAVDAVYGENQLKRGVLKGERLSLLPAGITDEQVTPKMIDEALSEIAEADILMNRKRDSADKVIKLEGGIISRNLMALSRLAPGATRKFRMLIDAARDSFGLSSARALALKKAESEGRFDREGYDAFLNKITGHDASAATEQVESSSAEEQGVGDSAFALAPLGPGARKITEAPKVVEMSNPFSEAITEPKDLRRSFGQMFNDASQQWPKVIQTPEGPITWSKKVTGDKLRFFKTGEPALLHYIAALHLPELLENSRLAAVEAEAKGDPNVQEVHRRYAWAEFPNGERRHVLITVDRMSENARPEMQEADHAYSSEVLGVSLEVLPEHKSADAVTLQQASGEKTPSAVLADASAQERLAQGSNPSKGKDIPNDIERFLAGIKPEHRFDESATSDGGDDIQITPAFSISRTQAIQIRKDIEAQPEAKLSTEGIPSDLKAKEMRTWMEGKNVTGITHHPALGDIEIRPKGIRAFCDIV